MARLNPLQAAAAAYASAKWTDTEWRQFGRDTGTSDILTAHPRLYRSLGFSDDDYPDAALEVIGRVLMEAVEDRSSEKARMELLADMMPDLPSWTNTNAPARTQRLFTEYLAARDISEIPEQWVVHHNLFDDYAASAGGLDVGEEVPSPAEVRRSSRSAAVRGSEQTAMPERVISGQGRRHQGPPRSIFIVHGHDEAALNSIRIYVHKHTGIMPVSLAEEPGRGSTIIEKFEEIGGEASYVIVLLTPDDVGQTVTSHEAGSDPDLRARQNVVLELGYFIGKIGRQNVLVVDAGVERPSDLAGLSYVQYPGTNWKDDLRVEVEAAGLTS